MKNEELLRRAPACAVGSPKPDGLGAAPRRRAKLQLSGKQAGFLHSPFFLLHFLYWGRGRQAMHLLCKQVDVGALPTDSTLRK